MVTRTRLNFTFIRTLPVLLKMKVSIASTLRWPMGHIPSPLLLVPVLGYKLNYRHTVAMSCRVSQILILIKSSFLQSSARRSDCSTRMAMAASRRRSWGASCGVWGSSRARRNSSRCYTRWTLTVSVHLFVKTADILTTRKNPS
jgi:hypothetical protein